MPASRDTSIPARKARAVVSPLSVRNHTARKSNEAVSIQTSPYIFTNCIIPFLRSIVHLISYSPATKVLVSATKAFLVLKATTMMAVVMFIYRSVGRVKSCRGRRRVLRHLRCRSGGKSKRKREEVGSWDDLDQRESQDPW